MKKQSLLDIINLLGSIASITGISLLWAKNGTSVSLIEIIWVGGFVSVCFGLLAFGLILIRSGYHKYVKSKDVLVKTVYFAIASPIIALGMSIIAAGILIGAKAVVKAVMIR